MRRQGYLSGKTARSRLDAAAAKGRRALEDSKQNIRELFKELIKEF